MALYKNLTGENSRIGLICKVDPKNPQAFIYATSSDTQVLGVITQSVPRYAMCEIKSTGETKVMVSNNAVQGSIIRLQKASDRISRATCKTAKSTDTPYVQIGTALESGRGLINVALNISGGSASEGYVPYVGANKDVNIGDHFITGRFIARPGNAAVGLAPLIFQAGDLLTVPEAGTMEFDGTGIYLTPTNHRRFITLASDSLIVSVTATTIAPTTLWTAIVNANELKAHRVYVIKACGLYTTDPTDVATITVKFGATTIGSITTPVGAITLGPWYMEIFITVRTTGGFGTISAFGRIDASTGSSYGVLESFVLDTTIINNLILTCSWSATGNGLRITQAWLSTAD